MKKEKIVFVFFDPWTVHTKKVKPIVDYMIQNGFDVIKYRYTVLRECDAENIYRKNHPISEKSNWYIPRLIYSMGPSCGLLLSYRYDNESATDAMAKLKGKSNPVLNDEKKIRKKFFAPNKALSLMHSSDDWESIVEESKPFFSHKELLECLEGYNKEDCMDGLYDDCYTGNIHINNESFLKLMIKIRKRCIAEINDFPIEKKELIDLWNNYYNHKTISFEKIYELYSKMVQDEAGVMKKILCTESREYIPVWSENINCENSAIVLLKILNRIELYPDLDTEYITNTFPFFYDDWERLLFKTGIFMFKEF